MSLLTRQELIAAIERVPEGAEILVLVAAPNRGAMPSIFILRGGEDGPGPLRAVVEGLQEALRGHPVADRRHEYALFGDDDDSRPH